MASVDIPKQQKAAVKVGSGADSKAPVKQIEVPTPGPGEILVKINWQVCLLGEVALRANKQPIGLAYVHRTSR